MSFLVILLVLWVEKFSAWRLRIQQDGPWLAQLQRLQQGGLQQAPRGDGTPVPVQAPPYRFEGARMPVRLPPPMLGEHTAAVLHERLGLDAAGVDALRAAGVV